MHRVWVVLLAIAFTAAALAAGDRLQRVELSDDFQTVTAFAPDGAVAFSYTIEDWRAWAEEHLDAALGGPVTIGDVAMQASTFYAFGFAEMAPDGRFVAYSLGSAHAFGDGLHVDDLEQRRRVLDLDAHAALASGVGTALGAVVDGFGWFPAFRELAWDDDGALAFATHDPAAGAEEGELRWRFDVGSGELRVD